MCVGHDNNKWFKFFIYNKLYKNLFIFVGSQPDRKWGVIFGFIGFIISPMGEDF
jgi:hypothetical protein